MDFKQLLQAKADADPSGAFNAVVATFDVDRTDERFVPGAFEPSLEKWRASGRRIPVLADHQARTTSVIGHIDPRLSTETVEGLDVTGVLDLTTELGRRAYELVKAGSVAWSVGHTVPKGGRRKRGGHVEITAVDLAEVSVVPVPANERVRTVSVKSFTRGGAPTMAQLEARAKALGVPVPAERPLRIISFEC
jgi:HK97 family phage prohead protease